MLCGGDKLSLERAVRAVRSNPTATEHNGTALDSNGTRQRVNGSDLTTRICPPLSPLLTLCVLALRELLQYTITDRHSSTHTPALPRLFATASICPQTLPKQLY